MHLDDFLMQWVYLPLAALTGAISSFGQRRIRNMSRGQIGLNIMMSACFSFFVTPWFALEWLGIPETAARKMVALTFLFGFGGHILLPVFIDMLKRLVGKGDVE